MMNDFNRIRNQLDKPSFQPRSGRWVTLPELKSEDDFTDDEIIQEIQEGSHSEEKCPVGGSGGYLTRISPFISHTHRRILGCIHQLSQKKDNPKQGFWDCNFYQSHHPSVLCERKHSTPYNEIIYNHLDHIFCKTNLQFCLVPINPSNPTNKHIHHVF
jgi:hypothetical protein